ncbi:MAG: hypothetical protein ACK4VO_03895 [Pseudobdellovibrio sp.]
MSNPVMTPADEISAVNTEANSANAAQAVSTTKAQATQKAAKSRDEDLDADDDEIENEKVHDRFGDDDDSFALDAQNAVTVLSEEEEDFNFDAVENILELPDQEFPKFTLAKNKARFLRMVSWYRQKEEWIEVAPLSGVQKLFKQQSKELEGIRASKMDYEMELETGTLTPSQRSYKKDELKMCRVQEKMAVHLISKLQLKIKSGRR